MRVRLELEEDDRVDARPPPLGVELPRPISDEGEVELGFQVAAEGVLRNEVFERDGDRLIKAARFGGAKHRQTLGEQDSVTTEQAEQLSFVCDLRARTAIQLG